MAKLVSSVYANALFEVGLEGGTIDTLYTELNEVADVFEANPDYFELIKTPNVNGDERKAIITETFEKHISKELLNFLKVLIDKKRANTILSVRREFNEFYYDHKGIVHATAYTVAPLGDDDISKLEARLSDLTGKTIQVGNVIEENLLGGMVVKIGDKIIDGSIRKKLNAMKTDLAKLIV
jgi:F-type H+-transporting ATPase subunit delta